ncbi:MAG: amidase [Polyangiaceae bacterium]|nr:amidase [Polyangiaceae bacterium]MCE7894050.1 amidase [Sorangiineae bacterium PRO1]MCL4754257.1 amidase [Myxococcales bacterium]
MTDLDRLDATALAELVRTKQATPLELVEHAIGRIEKLNPALNAVVTPMFDSARDAARKPLGSGPFAGVPFLVKDILAAVDGVRYTSGSRMLADFVAHEDSVLVERLRAAGFIFVGKTNVPEFGFLPTTEPVLFGPCKNPWNLAHSTGGSSGGSSAAVAARMVPAAHANDGGGSIRIPAACCGLFGLKPTRGRNSLGPALGDVMGGLVAEHAVTLSVRDSAAILDATHGPSIGDPYFAVPPLRPFVEEARTRPGKLRIGVSARPISGVDVHPDCVAALDDAKKLLAELGHDVVERDVFLPADMFMEAFSVLWTAGAAATLDGLALLTGRKASPDNVEPMSWALAEAGRQRGAHEYLISISILQRLSREWAKQRADLDVLVTPTLARPPAPLGSFDVPDNPLAGLFLAAEYAPFTPLQNMTGEPAANVPLFWNADGLPVGVQLVGRYGDEATLLRLSAQLEEARPWASRVPPIAR